MRAARTAGALGVLTLLLGSLGAARADVVHPLPYDLLYVRAPYFGPARRLATASGPTRCGR